MSGGAEDLANAGFVTHTEGEEGDGWPKEYRPPVEWTCMTCGAKLTGPCSICSKIG